MIGGLRQVCSGGVGDTVDLSNHNVIASRIVNGGVEGVEIIRCPVHEMEFAGDPVASVATDGGVVLGALDC